MLSITDTLMETQEFEVTGVDSLSPASEKSSDTTSSPVPSPPCDDSRDSDSSPQGDTPGQADTQIGNTINTDNNNASDEQGGEDEAVTAEEDDVFKIDGSSPESLLDEINEMLTTTSVVISPVDTSVIISPVRPAADTAADSEPEEVGSETHSLPSPSQTAGAPQLSQTAGVTQLSLADLSQLSEESLEDLEVQAITANATSSNTDITAPSTIVTDREAVTNIQLSSESDTPDENKQAADQIRLLAEYLRQSVYDLHALEVSHSY